MYDAHQPPVKACVLHIAFKNPKNANAFSRSPESCLDEIVGLAAALSLDVQHKRIVTLNKISPALVMGSGVVEDIKTSLNAYDITLVVVNGALTPIQQRNLEKAWGCKVIDRTGLILEIFGARARTAEGRLQVELAALSYQRSRLVRSWTHLERQRGGFGFTGGPGESQLELDRRLIDDRIVKIKKQLEQATRTRGLHRKARREVPYPVVALVGYTNAGKSTLFNTLTAANVLAQDLLFATLDPTMRQIKLPSGRLVILSDTVGFISDLPTQLVAAFRATLEEVCDADIILHVRDAAHPDEMHQAQDVLQILSDLGLQEATAQGALIDVYNKIDLLSSDDCVQLDNTISRSPHAVALSALTREGVDFLLKRIDRQLNRDRVLRHLTLPVTAGDALAWLYRNGAIVSRQDHEDSINLEIQISLCDLDYFHTTFLQHNT